MIRDIGFVFSREWCVVHLYHSRLPPKGTHYSQITSQKETNMPLKNEISPNQTLSGGSHTPLHPWDQVTRLYIVISDGKYIHVMIIPYRCINVVKNESHKLKSEKAFIKT